VNEPEDVGRRTRVRPNIVVGARCDSRTRATASAVAHRLVRDNPAEFDGVELE